MQEVPDNGDHMSTAEFDAGGYKQAQRRDWTGQPPERREGVWPAIGEANQAFIRQTACFI